MLLLSLAGRCRGQGVDVLRVRQMGLPIEVLTMKDLDYTIDDVGGIEHLDVKLKPGVNVLRGANAAGKTSAIRAIARAQGADVPLERRDGSERGMVQGPGVVLVVRKVASAAGDAVVELADIGPLGRVIDPGIKGTQEAARARIRALIELLDLGMKDSDIALLCGEDSALGDWMRGEPKDYDLIQASEKLRRKAHAMARAYEVNEKAEDIQRQTAEDRARDLLEDIGGREHVTAVTPTEAGEAHTAAIRAHDRAEVELAARAALRRHQAEIGAALGEQPDLGAARDAVEVARESHHEAYDRIKDLQAKLSLAKAVARSCSSDFDASAKHYSDVELHVVRHAKQREILDREPTGATADQVAELAMAVVGAQRDAHLARKSFALLAEQAHATDAKARQTKAKMAAERYRAIARNIPQGLGTILAEGGAPNLTVIDGRLHRVDGGMCFDFELRSSTGERIAAALTVAATAYKGKVVPLSGELWGALDPEHQQLFVREARERGLYVVTEDPSGGELRVEHEAEKNEREKENLND